VDTFVIVSGDSDLAAGVEVRENAKTVIASA